MAYVAIANGEAGLSVRGKINGIGTGLDSHIATTGSDVHSLGTISTQSANGVSITGGSISGASFISGSIVSSNFTTGSTTNSKFTAGSIISSSFTTGSITDSIISGGSIINISYPKTNVAVGDSPYTIKTTDFTIRCNATTGSIIVNLLPATGTGRIYNIKNLYTSACIVDVVADITGTPDLIDGEASKSLSVKSNMQIQDSALNYWDIL
jgi:hypothetical protein